MSYRNENHAARRAESHVETLDREEAARLYWREVIRLSAPDGLGSASQDDASWGRRREAELEALRRHGEILGSEAKAVALEMRFDRPADILRMLGE